MSRVLCLLAAHTSTNTKYNVLKNNITKLSSICDKFVIINSEEFIDQDIQYKLRENLNFHHNIDITYVSNDLNLLCTKKWHHYFTNNDEWRLFDKIILTNDSFILTREIKDFALKFNEPNIDLTGILASNQIQYHYPDFLRVYSKEGILNWIVYVNSVKSSIKSVSDLIRKIEVESTQIFVRRNVLYEGEKSPVNIHFEESLVNRYLNDLDYPIIKLKMLMTVADYNNMPPDFSPSLYKSLHADLSHMTNIEAYNHFITCGRIEKRKCFPVTMNNKTTYTDIPDDFNVAVYKSLHQRLRTSTTEEAFQHFINVGMKEGWEYKTTLKINISRCIIDYLERKNLIWIIQN